MATANGIPPLWHERRTLWASGKGYNPSTIASVGSWKWDFSFPIPRYFDNSPNGARERAPPPSPLRGLAYAEQRQPPPPSEDPAGWEACSEIIANGVLFGDRKVTVMYK
ncbi:hypothetical protein FRC07_011585, partial [Ceratobasidium sp. 392]